jgi:hypothetical protein
MKQQPPYSSPGTRIHARGSYCAISGKRIHLVALPDAVTAVASELFVKKYVETSTTLGQKTKPSPTHLHMPYANTTA